MNNWKDFFTLVYHPNPGVYIIHWADRHIPVDNQQFLFVAGAVSWIKENGQILLDRKFEEIVLK